MTEELYKRYRPKTFKEVIGQKDAIKMLNDMGRRGAIPHTLLFTGPSGTGKTTIARILKNKLKCSGTDYVEMNAANSKGIDMVRGIQQRVGLAPLSGTCRVWLIDECAQLTTAAQDAFLKLLEDTPKHAYFFLATTDPQKLKKTIITRATEIKCKPLTKEDLELLIRNVLEKEDAKLNGHVINKIAFAADGSARKALVILHAIIGLEDEEDQLHAVEALDVKEQAFTICRALMSDKTSWVNMAEILNKVEEDPETVRWMVLSYCTKVMLGNGKGNARAALILEYFSENFNYTKKAGLVSACWNVFNG